MRKIVFLFIFVIAACTPVVPDVTVTSEVTVTSIPSSTPLPPSPVPSATVTPKAVEPNVIALESMGCYKDDMCLGLEVVDGPARYTELLDAFVRSYENQVWMGELDTAEQFRAFLQTSMHIDPVTGEMRPYWVPLERNRDTFKILQGNGSATGALFSDKNKAIVEAGGFFLDDIAFVVASKAEIDANKGGIADWLNTMWEQNGKNVLVRSGNGNTSLEQSGWALLDGQLFFVAVNNGTPRDGYPAKSRLNLLGQGDAKRNGQIVSALWKMHIDVHFKFVNSSNVDHLSNWALEPDSNKWYSPDLCVADGGSASCEGQIPDLFAGDKALFVPAE